MARFTYSKSIILPASLQIPPSMSSSKATWFGIQLFWWTSIPKRETNRFRKRDKCIKGECLPARLWSCQQRNGRPKSRSFSKFDRSTKSITWEVSNAYIPARSNPSMKNIRDYWKHLKGPTKSSQEETIGLVWMEAAQAESPLPNFASSKGSTPTRAMGRKNSLAPLRSPKEGNRTAIATTTIKASINL